MIPPLQTILSSNWWFPNTITVFSCLHEIKYNHVVLGHPSAGMILSITHLTQLSINILTIYYKARKIKLKSSKLKPLNHKMDIKLKEKHIPKLILACESLTPHVPYLSSSCLCYILLLNSPSSLPVSRACNNRINIV